MTYVCQYVPRQKESLHWLTRPQYQNNAMEKVFISLSLSPSSPSSSLPPPRLRLRLHRRRLRRRRRRPNFPTAVCIHSLRPCICIHTVCMAINAVRKRHPAASATAAAGIEAGSRPPPPTRDAELGKSGRLRLRFRQRRIIFDNYSAAKRLGLKYSWRLRLRILLCRKCSEYGGSGFAPAPHPCHPPPLAATSRRPDVPPRRPVVTLGKSWRATGFGAKPPPCHHADRRWRQNRDLARRGGR